MSEQNYQRYIKHTLNSSPSKTAYTFSKGSRFQSQRTQNYGTIHLSPNKKYTQNGRGVTNSQKESYSQKKKKQDFEIFAVRRELGHILKEMERDRLVPKLEQPGFKYTYISKYKALREEQQQKQAKKNSSPHKRYQSPRSRNNLNESIKHSKSSSKINQRVQTQARRDEEDPQSRITCYGYYPTGLETQASGRYFNSKIKSVSGPSFGPPPPKLHEIMARQRENDSKASFYNTFSQFGPSRY